MGQLVEIAPQEWRRMNMRSVIVFVLSLMVVATTGCVASAQQGDRFALVIGNAKYPDAEVPLKNSINDAREMAKELRREGFDVDVGENLKKDAMRSAFDRLYGKIKSGSIALVFFSGYGIQSNRQSYMVPVDAQIWTEADVRRDGFSIDSMLNEMNIRGAKVKIAIINASRRNPFERRFRPVAAGLAPVIAPRDTLIMYSAAPGTVASDAAADRGTFVSDLVKEMRSPGLTAEEVFIHTRLSVTKDTRGEQTPWFSSSLAAEFYFTPGTRPEPSPPPPVVTNNPPPEPPPAKEPETKTAEREPPADPETAVRRDYNRAADIGTRKAWNDFLNKHPTGHYAILAEDQIAKLDTKSTPPAEEPPPAKKAEPKQPKVEKSTADDDEIRRLTQRLEDNPRDVNSHYKRGILYAKNGEFGLAVKDFDEVVRHDPHDADALNNRCWARAMLDELQTALKDCDEALRIRPRFSDALDSRGLVKLKIGLPRNAISDYDASLRINSNQASSLYGRGIAKMRSGNTSGGNSDIAAAKAIDPHIAEEFESYGIR
jgi:Caspase domain/Tetratricopeptide repeat